MRGVKAIRKPPWCDFGGLKVRLGNFQWIPYFPPTRYRTCGLLGCGLAEKIGDEEQGGVVLLLGQGALLRPAARAPHIRLPVPAMFIRLGDIKLSKTPLP